MKVKLLGCLEPFSTVLCCHGNVPELAATCDRFSRHGEAAFLLPKLNFVQSVPSNRKQLNVYESRAGRVFCLQTCVTSALWSNVPFLV